MDSLCRWGSHMLRSKRTPLLSYANLGKRSINIIFSLYVGASSRPKESVLLIHETDKMNKACNIHKMRR